MKKIVRISALSVLVLTAMAFSAFSVMAMTPGSETSPLDSATVAAGPKQEVAGTVTAVDATSITLNGTVYTLSASTQTHGSVQVGDTVKLEIVTNPDGSLTIYEVSKPDSSGASVDVSSTEPARIDPVGTVESVGTETVSPDKSNVNDPMSTVELVHTEVASPDKGPSTDTSHDKNNVDSAPDKSNSSPDKNSVDAGQASGHDNSSGPSHPESADTSSAPAGNDQ